MGVDINLFSETSLEDRFIDNKSGHRDYGYQKKIKKNDNKINRDKEKRQEQKIGKSITLNYHQRQMIKNIVQKSMDFQKHKQEKAAATFASDCSNSDNHDSSNNSSEIGISSPSIPEKSGDYFLFDYRCALLH